MPLNFNEHIVAPENIDQQFGTVCGIPGGARVSRANASPAQTDGVLATANFSCAMQALKFRFKERLFRRDTETNTRDACATQKRDQPFRKLRQLIPFRCALPFLAAQMRLRE